jgi:hypothetical protein
MILAKYVGSVPLWIRSVLTKETLYRFRYKVFIYHYQAIPAKSMGINTVNMPAITMISSSWLYHIFFKNCFIFLNLNGLKIALRFNRRALAEY